jgi:Protein of unknown function (DUF3489)
MRRTKKTTPAPNASERASRAQQRPVSGRTNRRTKVFRIHDDGIEMSALVGQKKFWPGGMEEFATERQLGRLTASWPVARLVGMWNGLPGAKRVHRFTDRKTAVRRIWKAIQTLDVGSRGTRAVDSGRGKSEVIGRSSPASGDDGRATKAAQVIALLQRPSGATLQAIMAATGWQSHSVRGFISGQLRKRMRLKVQSSERAGERVYSIRR